MFLDALDLPCPFLLKIPNVIIIVKVGALSDFVKCVLVYVGEFCSGVVRASCVVSDDPASVGELLD